MTEPTSPRRRGAPLTLPGTARDQEARRKELVGAIRRSIRDAERAIAIGRRLLAQTDDGVTAELLVQCVNALGLYYVVGRVLGVDVDPADDDARRGLIGAIDSARGKPRRRRNAAALAGTAPAIPSPVTSNRTPATIDVAQEAIAIARSAGGDVDWHREPLTDRERRIRARWIERYLDGSYEGACAVACKADAVRLRLGVDAALGARGRPIPEPQRRAMPGDLAAAADTANAIMEHCRRERDAEEYRELDDLDDDFDD